MKEFACYLFCMLSAIGWLFFGRITEACIFIAAGVVIFAGVKFK